MSEARDVASTVLDAFRDELVVRLVDLCNVNNFDRLTLLKTYDTINEIYDKHIKKWLYADTVDIAPDTKWISVKERLPDESGDYLTFRKSGICAVLSYSARYHAFNSSDNLPKSSLEWRINVTHWMPLPEPPKEEGENT